MESIVSLSEVAKLVIVNPKYSYCQQEIIEIIADSGAILKGHFALLSERHSEYFFRFSKISRRPEYIALLSTFLGREVVNHLKEGIVDRIDAIFGPETAGSALVRELTRLLCSGDLGKKVNAEAIIAKTDKNKRITSVINGVDLKKDNRIVLANDLTTTGSGIRALVSLASGYDARVVGLCLIGTRRNAKELVEELKTKLEFVEILVDFKFQEYEPGNCLLCSSEESEELVSSSMVN